MERGQVRSGDAPQPLLTPHALLRMRQRGIRAEALEVLLDFGRVRHLHQNGREIIYFDKKARSRLARANPTAAREAEKLTRTYAIMARLGQGAFRVLVTEAYDRRCAITGECTLPVLEAAHIKPFSQTGPHLVSNGLLLRSDLHILFDDGYVTVTDDYRVEVSNRIKEEFENGRDYYRYVGTRLSKLPDSVDERPAADFLRWHNEHVYLG